MDIAVKLFYWALVMVLGANIFALVYLGNMISDLRDQIHRIERRR